MKKSSFLISLFFVVACNQAILNTQKSSYTKTETSSPKVYFPKSNDFQEIRKLNREDKSLNLYDQIVFLNENDFLKNKNNHFFKLEPLNNFINNKEDIKIKVSSFCSYSKQNLSNPEKENRMFQELVSSSFHPSFSIIDLIPKDFLLEYLDKEFYCTFIFSIKKNKSKKFTRYTLTQQKIKADFSNRQETPLNLVQTTHYGYEYISTNYVLNKNNIKTTLLLNNTTQKVTTYEMFCAGKKVMTVPSLKAGTSSIFSHLINVTELPKGLKNCHFFSKNENKIIGLTSPFLLDFDSLNIKNKSIDLSLLEEPIFEQLPPYPFILPILVKTRAKLKEGEKRKYTKRTLLEVYPSPFYKLNSYIHFTNLNTILQSGVLNSIEMTVKTECLNVNSKGQYMDNVPYSNFIESSSEGLIQPNNTITNIKTLPLREKTPIAITLPSNIFEIGITFDHWLRKMMILQNTIDNYEIELNKDIKSKKRLGIMDEYYRHKMQEERELQEIKHQIICLYKINLEDKNNPHNKREFETQAYRILWGRDGYGVSYTAFPEGKNPFISIEQQISQSKYNEAIHYKSKMGYLSLNFFDLIESSNLQEESYGLENFSLVCKDLVNRTLNLSWPYNSIINNQIVLENLFKRSEFKKYIDRYPNNQINCRILFYGQNNLLKYFSGEIRLHNINTDLKSISRPEYMFELVSNFLNKNEEKIKQELNSN